MLTKCLVEIKPCRQCGTLLVWRVNAHRPVEFCSRACRNRARGQHGENRVCKACGAAFYVYPSYLTKPGRTNEFCSHKCKGVRTGERMRGVPKTILQRQRLSATRTGMVVLKRRKPPVRFTCLNCEQPAEKSGRYTYRLAKNMRFCNTACWYSYIRKHPEESGHFRGGYEPYYGPNWLEQARLARERDLFTCQDCGLEQRQPLLDVHHLVPRRSFKGDHVAANVLANLVTLCKRCHTVREHLIDRVAV